MSVAEWTDDTYDIHHWRIISSSNRKLTWVGFEPTTTKFFWDGLTDWAIKPWVQLALRANFVQLLQFHCLFSAMFRFGLCLRQWPRLFELTFHWGNHRSVAEWTDDTCGIHHWQIISCRYRKLTWIRFETTTTEFLSTIPTDWAIRPWVQLALRANFVQLLQFHHLFSIIFISAFVLHIFITQQ